MKPLPSDRFTTKMNKKSGLHDFYLDGKDVTNEWMWFFSGLSSEQEKNCINLFIKWWDKKHKSI